MRLILASSQVFIKEGYGVRDPQLNDNVHFYLS